MSDFRTVSRADLSPQQTAQCLGLLSDAFVSDLGFAALWGRRTKTVPMAQARTWFAALFTLLEDDTESVLAAIQGETVVGVIVTTRSDSAPSSKKMLGWLWRSIRKLGPGIALRTARHDRRRATLLPEHPARIVEFICVANAQRGQGLAGTLFDVLSQTCQIEDRVLWLETTKPQNVSVFSKYGFVESGRYQHLDVLNICMVKKI